MLSLWGKLTNPSASSEEADEKYYFSTESGQIVSVDGSGYVLPAIEESVIEKTDYIPLDFAHGKIKSLSDEANLLREAYQKHLAELDVFYRQTMTETKTHYESLIKDLKAKALRHVEIRKQMQQQSEHKLSKELKQSEDSVDELRNSMASLNREYQEEVRTLKTNIAESVRVMEEMRTEISTLKSDADQVEQRANARHMTDVNTRLACTAALNSIMHKVELTAMQSDLFRLQEAHNKVKELQVAVFETEEKNVQFMEQLRQADVDRTEATALHEQTLCDMEDLKLQHNTSLEELKATYATQTADAKRQYLEQIELLYDQVRRAEAEVSLTHAVGRVIERTHTDTLTSLNGEHNASTLEYHRQQENLVRRYDEQLSAQRASFEEDNKALRKKFGAKLQAASERLRKIEVNLCLKDMVLNVLERFGSQATASVPYAQLSPRSATTAMDATAPASTPPEHTALLARVQDLEDQIEQQKQHFDTLVTKLREEAASAAAVKGPSPSQEETPNMTDEQTAWAEELALLRSQEVHASKQLDQATALLTRTNVELIRLNADKETCKNDIKDWSRNFLEENGREPNVQDKATVKDKYQKYKVLSAKVKELESTAASQKEIESGISAKLQDLELQIERLLKLLRGNTTSNAGEPVVVTSTPANVTRELVDAEMQTEDTRGGMLRRSNTQKALESQATSEKLAELTGDQRKIAELEQALDAEALTIEQLDDQIYQLKQDFEKTVVERDQIEKERVFLAAQVDTLVKAKRTDVVKQYEEEIERLNESQSVLNDRIAQLTADKAKNEARLAELQDRVNVAEGELKDRDAKDVHGLDTKDEKVLLKGQISKQREQIILKAKAATAGWDAAANSDERLDVEVERAFKKGFAEERQKHIDEMKALNSAIEVKEGRITELLVAMAEMERKVMQSDAQVAEMTKVTDAMKLEVADTIASLSQMALNSSGSGGEGLDGEAVLGPTAAELDDARDQLDAAQEELVGLMERCDRLEVELEVARRKNRVFQELAALTGIDSATSALKKAKAIRDGGQVGRANPKAASSASAYDVSDVINIIKKAVNKGTNMWKSNRKDECFDLYLESCQDCLDKLLTSELKGPLGDAISSGKGLGIQNKQRGAVVLRKALDKLGNDLDKAGPRQAEEDEAARLRGQAAEAADAEDEQGAEQVSELVAELDQIESSFLEQGYTKDRNPSNSSSAGTVQASPRAGSDGNNAPSSLLARAKSAEAAVVNLKKQLAAVVAATAARANTESSTAGATAQTTSATTGPAGTVRRSAGAGGASGGADPAEVRKLNRKIKELETQIKSGAGNGGGGASGAELKALQQSEKVLQKKLKDAENNFKRESKGIEMRAVKAENALQKIEGTYNAVVSEREKLKTENAKLSGLPAELAALRAKTEYFEKVEAQLDSRNKEYDILAEQFKKETTLRKKYKNELEDLKGAIRVYARCRPMAKYELEKGCKSVVEIKDETSLRVVTSRGDKDFEFDAVFGEASTQDQVFEDTKRLVESCMDGFNVCLFAYGQTGSGKTFTMTGSTNMPGLTPKAIDELFRLVDERAHVNVRVTTYFVELYNDNLVDLYWVLDNKGRAGMEPPKLDIKMDAKKMVYIRNAIIKDAASPEELMDLFNAGNLERHTGATKMNAESSRSHSIFAIMVESYDTATKRTTTGKLSLVDLAGSERADKTGAAADRLKEAQSINKSLSALGDVIAALSEGTKFIPYRNNKLTQVMQDSLGGNAKTLMFVNFSPADYNSDETSTSLMYAARVKKIVNNASKQAESEEVARLKQIIKRLQAGQPVEAQLPGVGAVGEEEEDDAEPPPADDGKVYDGY